MKNLLAFALIVIGSYVVQFILPWWGFALIGFIVAFFLIRKIIAAFLIGLISVFLLWIIQVLIIDTGVEISAASAIASILGGLPEFTGYILTGIIGGIIGGFAAMTGSYARRSFYKEKVISSS